MRWLIEDATPKCDHGGRVDPAVSQHFVRISRRCVLTKPDLEGRPIVGCPNANFPAGILPCKQTLKVAEGYSLLVRIAHIPVALEAVRGLTNGSPPGAVKYTIVDPAQEFVTASA